MHHLDLSKILIKVLITCFHYLNFCFVVHISQFLSFRPGQVWVGMDDREKNCLMVCLRGTMCSFEENNGKRSVNGD